MLSAPAARVTASCSRVVKPVVKIAVSDSTAIMQYYQHSTNISIAVISIHETNASTDERCTVCLCVCGGGGGRESVFVCVTAER